MKKGIYIALFTSAFLTSTLAVNAGRGGSNNGGKKSVRAGGTRRAGGSKRASAINAIRNSGVNTTSTSTDDTEKKSTSKVKTVQECEKVFFDCMDNKTRESLMANEALYTDYEDMVSEFYSGLQSPVFKCIYSDDVRDLYSKYNYGFQLSDSSSRIEQIRRGSIYYYMFLKENATNVVNRSYIIQQVDSEVLSIAGVEKSVEGQSDPALWDVSYSILSVQPKALWKTNLAYCSDPMQNEELAGCSKLKSDIAERWLANVPTKKQSCADYETFLKNTLSRAKSDSTKYIQTLRKQLESLIDEYNLKTDSERELALLDLKQKETDGLKNLKEQCQKSTYEICKKAVAKENSKLNEQARYKLYEQQCFRLFEEDINDCRDPLQFAIVSRDTETSVAEDVAKLTKGMLGRLVDPNPIHHITGAVSDIKQTINIGVKSVKKFFGW